MFSVLSVCQSWEGPHVTITHDALDFTVQDSWPWPWPQATLQTWEMMIPQPCPHPAPDIWLPSLELGNLLILSVVLIIHFVLWMSLYCQFRDMRKIPVLRLKIFKKSENIVENPARAWIHFPAPYKVIIRVQQLVLVVLASIGWHHCRTQNAIGPRNWSTVMWPASIGWWRRVSPAIYTTRAQDLGSVVVDSSLACLAFGRVGEHTSLYWQYGTL